MSRNLADPTYEPTDEELAELMRRANEHATRSRFAAEAALRARMAMERTEALARTAALLAGIETQ